MASLEENYHFWNNVYDWSRYQGDEWSARWGGADVQWNFVLRPRIHRFLPTGTILEIGPGHGRFSQYLKQECQSLILVDLAERCIHACKERFAGEAHLVYRVGDGRTLPGVEDHSLDFAFSFESLVHAELDVLEDYLKELARTLIPGGAAFLHHSNLGAYPRYFALTGVLPRELRRSLKKAHLLDFNEWRAPGVTAARIQELASRHGLSVTGQELVNWGGRRLIDCLTTLINTPGLPNTVLQNPGFIARAYAIQRLSPLYGRGVPW